MAVGVVEAPEVGVETVVDVVDEEAMALSKVMMESVEAVVMVVMAVAQRFVVVAAGADAVVTVLSLVTSAPVVMAVKVAEGVKEADLVAVEAVEAEVVTDSSREMSQLEETVDRAVEVDAEGESEVPAAAVEMALLLVTTVSAETVAKEAREARETKSAVVEDAAEMVLSLGTTVSAVMAEMVVTVVTPIKGFTLL